MKLLELLRCGGRALLTEEAPPVSGTREDGETAARLGRPEASSSRRRKAGAKASSSTTSTPWRPSLAAISENGTHPKVSPAASARRSGKAGACLPAKAKSGDPRRVLPRSYSEEYEQVSPVVPAFTPTAFLF